ncbi:MAG: SH3 domain-containing protein [Saprospiraceae bacterium]|nr:SH3 domain-containing protein [Saprospiraceae bacterium]
METRILFMVMLIITSLINFDSNAFIRNSFVPKTPRRIALCSGRVISPSITLLRNDSLEVLGKCYGYVNCTACTTCNFCGYCNSGGSCGVCGKRYSSPSPLPKPKPIPIPDEKKDPPIWNIPNKMYINEDNVNLRSDPHYESKVIGKLQFGEVVDSLKRSFFVQDVFPYGKAYWYHVRTKDKVEGWVFSKLLVSEEDLLDDERSEKLKIKIHFVI